MLMYQVNENNFNEEVVKQGGMPIVLMSMIMMAVSEKYPTLNDIKDYALVVVHNPVITSEKNENVLDIFELKKVNYFDDEEEEEEDFVNKREVFQDENKKDGKFLVVVKKGDSFNLELNGEKREFRANNLIMEIKEENGVNRKDEFQPKTMTAQEMLALDWLKHGNDGASALSMCVTIFPKLRQYFENVTGKEKEITTPRDSDDFSRCLEFTKEVRLFPDQIQKMAEVDGKWKKLVDVWEEIESKFNAKNYEGAGDLIREANKINSKKP